MPNGKLTIRLYRTASGRVPVGEWRRALDAVTRGRVDARLARIRAGNLGDCRSLRGGLHELRLNLGPGLRIYFARDGGEVVLLLCAGDKGSQRQDVRLGRGYYQDFLERRHG